MSFGHWKNAAALTPIPETSDSEGEAAPDLVKKQVAGEEIRWCRICYNKESRRTGLPPPGIDDHGRTMGYRAVLVFKNLNLEKE